MIAKEGVEKKKLGLSFPHLVVIFGPRERFLVDTKLEHVANRNHYVGHVVHLIELMPLNLVGILLLEPVGLPLVVTTTDHRCRGAGPLFADVVEHQIVLLQGEAQHRERRNTEQETREDVRILHLAGESLSSVAVIISC